MTTYDQERNGPTLRYWLPLTRFEVDDLKVRVWHEMLGDLDYAVASMAVKKIIMQNTFAPAIAEVRKAATEIMSPEQVTGSEAWGEVTRAIRHYGYYRETEALASMPPQPSGASHGLAGYLHE